jgi:hypothetical protein
VDLAKAVARCREIASAYRVLNQHKDAARFDEAVLLGEELLRKPSENQRPRDERGWLIPADGTITRQIYDMVVLGKTRAEIKACFPERTLGQIDACLYRIRNPEKENAKSRRASKRRYLKKRSR